jgi:hypothetical protein
VERIALRQIGERKRVATRRVIANLLYLGALSLDQVPSLIAHDYSVSRWKRLCAHFEQQDDIALVRALYDATDDASIRQTLPRVLEYKFNNLAYDNWLDWPWNISRTQWLMCAASCKVDMETCEMILSRFPNLPRDDGGTQYEYDVWYRIVAGLGLRASNYSALIESLEATESEKMVALGKQLRSIIFCS